MDEEPSATGLPQEIGQPRDFELEPGSIPVGAIVEARSMGRACCRGACYFIFVGEYRASSCWYLCWYRQQSTIKVTSNSNGYGTKRLPARGTNLRSFGWQATLDPIRITYSIVKQHGRHPSPAGAMLYGVVDADQLAGIIPVLKGLLSWLSKLPRDLSTPVNP
jgi:hypothetical protein